MEKYFYLHSRKTLRVTPYLQNVLTVVKVKAWVYNYIVQNDLGYNYYFMFIYPVVVTIT